MNLMRRMMCTVLLLASFSPLTASAYTEVQGQIGSLQVLGDGAGAPGAYDVRVYLSNGGLVCGGFNWAYFNVGDRGYSGLLATLLSAKALGSTVSLDTTPDPGTGYCHLAFVAIQ